MAIKHGIPLKYKARESLDLNVAHQWTNVPFIRLYPTGLLGLNEDSEHEGESLIENRKRAWFSRKKEKEVMENGGQLLDLVFIYLGVLILYDYSGFYYLGILVFII